MNGADYLFVGILVISLASGLMRGFVREAISTHFGTLEGGSVHEFDGDMYLAARPTGRVLRLSEVELLTPCQPSKVIAMYNNFAELFRKGEQRIPAGPQYLLKPPNTYLGHGGVIHKPSCDSRIIFEGELAVVIGRTCKDVPRTRRCPSCSATTVPTT